MIFSDEQELIIKKFKQKNNIFITGPGGSGKTEIIKYIYDFSINLNKKIQICALTGCAAVLLNCKAKTIHSWSGIGLANDSIESIVKKILFDRYKLKKWLNIDILVIDEVSMMSLKIFELLDIIGKTTRRNKLPFGGIQLIFSGDFYQLPPVGDNSLFCFESKLWNITFKKENCIQLTKIFRQKDIIFSNILNEVRIGKISKNSIEILEERLIEYNNIDSNIKPTRIFPIKSKVEFINKTELEKLETEEFIFEYKKINTSELNDDEVLYEQNYILNNLLCEKILKLKVGSQVMCIANITLPNGELLCNGSQGIILRFDNKIPIVKFTNGIVLGMNYHFWESENILDVGISQIPLILAWAITIHKSQGSTMDLVELDIGCNIFECGQIYVALSRVKSLEGLYISSFNPKKIKINKKVREFYDELNNNLEDSLNKLSIS
jgi:ATP-dependent DNA helicase PIF1